MKSLQDVKRAQGLAQVSWSAKFGLCLQRHFKRRQAGRQAGRNDRRQAGRRDNGRTDGRNAGTQAQEYRPVEKRQKIGTGISKRDPHPPKKNRVSESGSRACSPL